MGEVLRWDVKREKNEEGEIITTGADMRRDVPSTLCAHSSPLFSIFFPLSTHTMY